MELRTQQNNPAGGSASNREFSLSRSLIIIGKIPRMTHTRLSPLSSGASHKLKSGSSRAISSISSIITPQWFVEALGGSAERVGPSRRIHSGVFGLSPRVQFTYDLTRGRMFSRNAYRSICFLLLILIVSFSLHYSWKYTARPGNTAPGVVLFWNQTQVTQYDAIIPTSIPPADCGSRIPNLELIRTVQINGVCSK